MRVNQEFRNQLRSLGITNKFAASVMYMSERNWYRKLNKRIGPEEQTELLRKILNTRKEVTPIENKHIKTG